MSLSEIISKLDIDENIKFERQAGVLRVMIKKGYHPKNCKVLALNIDLVNADGAIDVIAFEVASAIEMIRRD